MRPEIAFARMRWLAYAALLPLGAVIALDLRRPEGPAAAALAGGLAVAALLARTGALGEARVERIRSRRVWRAIDLVLWNAVVIVLALEASLSIAALVVDHPLLTAPNAKSRERIRNARFAPHAPLFDGRANAHGFHDSEWDAPKPAGRLRVAALGDSFAVGIVPYRKNVLTLLEERLRARLARDVEVCNLGVAGTNPADYEAILGDEGLLLAPDAVLVCVFSGNDFEAIRTGSRLRGPNWRTWAVIERGVNILRHRARRAGTSTPAPAQAPPDRPERFSHEGYLDLVMSNHLEPLARPLPQAMEKRVVDTIETLGRIVERARPRPVVVAVFPSEVQVRRSLLLEVAAKRGVREEALDLDQPARRIRDALAPRGVKVVDVRPALLAAEAARGPLYEPDDSHWNEAGNAVAAEAIADAITDTLRGL